MSLARARHAGVLLAAVALLALASACGDKPAAPAGKQAAKPGAAAPNKPVANAAAPAAPAPEKPLDAAGIEEIFATIPSQDSLDAQIAPTIDASNADQWLEKLAQELAAPAK